MTDARVAVGLTARNEEGSLLEKYYRFLFAKEKSSRLVAKKDLEADLKEVHSDIHRQDPIVLWVLWKLMTMVWQKQSIRRGPYSQGKELYYQPVSSHQPPERRGKDFLQCPGMQTGWLPREEWLH